MKTLKDCKNLEEARELAIKSVKHFIKIGELQCAIEFTNFFNLKAEDLK